jgi:hypothetical protein
MARRVALTGAAVLVVLAAVFLIPFATRKREVTVSAPAGPPLPPASLVPATIKPGSRLCIRQLALSPDDQVARVLVQTGGRPGPPLRVDVTAPGYSATSTVQPGYRDGPLEIALTPPRRSMRGDLCVQNTGRAAMSILASGVGEKLSRPQPELDGTQLQQDVPIVFHERAQASLANRTGELIGHASVFTPLPRWSLWLLLALVLLVLPAAAIGAVAKAAAAPAALPRAQRVTAAPPLPGAGLVARVRPPLRRAARPLRRVPTWAWVTAIVLAACVFFYVWANRTTTFQPDEAQNVYFARWLLNNLPQGLWNFSFLQRGLQRAEIWVLAFGFHTFESPAAFRAVHLINSVAFASAAIPGYLLARGAGARKLYAVVAAVLVVAIPWVVVVTSFLTEPLAYPAFMWVIWAFWRVLVRPSVRSELVAFIVLFAALLTRSAFLLLAPVLPIAVVIQELRFGPRNAHEVVRRHLLLTVAVLVGVAYLLAAAAGIAPSPKRLAGSYGTPFSLDWGLFFSKVGFWTSRVVVGSGFIPFAVGLPWLIVELVRPRHPRRHAFALVTLLAFVLLLYATYSAGPDERYVMYFAAPLAVAALVAFDKRDLRPLWVVAGGLFAAWLVRHHTWNPNLGPAGYFVAPAESFYARVGLLHLQQDIPGSVALRDAAFIVAAGLTALLAYAFTRRPRAGLIAACALAFLVVLQVAQAEYSMDKFTATFGGRYATPVDQHAWVDRALSGKPGDAAIWNSGVGNRGDYDYIWTDVQFWNSRVTGQYAEGGALRVSIPPGDYLGSVGVDQDTGAMQQNPPLPPWLVLPRDYVRIVPAGTPVVRPSFAGLDLWKIDHPAHARAVVLDAPDDGSVTQESAPTVRFFGAGLDPAKRWCGYVPIQAAGAGHGQSPPIPYHVGPRRGVIPPGGQVGVTVPLDFRGRAYVDVPVKLRGKVTTFDGSVYAGHIHLVGVMPCSGG